MFKDVCTCDISLQNPVAITEWDQMVKGFLAHTQSTPIHLGKVLELEPGFAMAHAARGLFSLMLGKAELFAVATDAGAAARAALSAGGATRRERLWCDALDAWLGGRPTQSISCMEQALRLNPADTLSAKVCHAIRFILGDSVGLRQSIERVLPAHGLDHPLRGYALGCLAFAQEETGSYRAAEKSGLMALEHVNDDAWGLHAVAHVYDMTNRPDHGIALIQRNIPAWDHCNNFRYHVWWHQALLHLDQGDYATVLSLYDSKIRQDKTDDYRDFSNASSLLTRLELEGVNVGDRWAELADLAETRADDGCLVFADLHYMLALAGDKRADAVARMTARVARDAGETNDQAKVMCHPGLAAAEGLAAFGEGQYDLAFAKLSAAQPKFQIIGGSHAQRDVFERITIDAGLRAGRLDAAEVLLQTRTALRAGREDAYTAARTQMINDARDLRPSVAAE
ncbi:MAG: tetratricopeptide repeat protein [Pseudomonadota bacterium]